MKERKPMSSETVLLEQRPAPLPVPLRLPAIRPLQLRDRAPLHQLLTKDVLFTYEEIALALELLEGALAKACGEYRVLEAVLPAENVTVASYARYGLSPELV